MMGVSRCNGPHGVLIHFCGIVWGLSCIGLAQASDSELETVIVSASRIEQTAGSLPLTSSIISGDDIQTVSAQHSNQLFTRVAGAWVSRGNGQESLIALRSPVLTGAGSCGAFMTAEDGIPLRAPGFCNVNQLFDANLLQAGRVEVLMGPATVVYGSSAMHGIINVVTRSVAETPNQIRVEGGSRDYYRLSGSAALESIALSAQTSRYGGFQDASGYEQHKGTLRVDHQWGEWRIDGALEGSQLHQETAGYIQGKDLYQDKDARKQNPNPEAYRDAWSARAHLGMSRELSAGTQLSIRPYWRANNMSFLQHFVPWQPTETNQQQSVGVQITANGGNSNLAWLAGIDLDRTTGKLLERQDTFFSPNQPDGIHYDYEVDAEMIAGFSHLSWTPHALWQLDAGIRWEENRYDYDNRASDGSACAPTASACRFIRPADREDRFSNWTGNIGISFDWDEALLFARAAQGFRAPQTTELYRLQSGQTVTDLDSEEIESLEIGLRQQLGALSYELSAYWMRKDNVIFQDRNRYNVRGAQTTHRGVELTANWQLSEHWSLRGNATYSQHRYDNEIELLGVSDSIKGNDIDTAPKHYGSVQLRGDFSVANTALMAELEWLWLGQYWVDPENQHRYDGHQLLNARVSWQLSDTVTTTLVITNVLDEDYAERADLGFGNYRYFVGEPRSAVLGITFSL